MQEDVNLQRSFNPVWVKNMLMVCPDSQLKMMVRGHKFLRCGLHPKSFQRTAKKRKCWKLKSLQSSQRPHISQECEWLKTRLFRLVLTFFGKYLNQVDQPKRSVVCQSFLDFQKYLVEFSKKHTNTVCHLWVDFAFSSANFGIADFGTKF